MRSTLFYIPAKVFDLPLFGFGLLLAIWGVFCAAFLGWRVYRYGWSKEMWAELPMLAVMGAVIAFVLPRVGDSYGLPIRGYGVMVFLGIALAVWLAVYRAKREGYPAELIYSLAVWLVISGIVGGRLFYVIEYWPKFHKETLLATLGAMAKYTEGGLVVYGAFLGGAAAAIAFFIRHKLPVFAFGDIISPSVMLGLALGRLGCFLNGCCYGGQCDLPWAVTFPPGSPPFYDQVNNGLIPLHGIKLEGKDKSDAVVEAVAADSPAAAAGLAKGDKLLAITIAAPESKDPLVFPFGRKPSVDEPLSVSEANTALFEATLPETKVRFDVLTKEGQLAKREWVLTQLAQFSRSLPVHPAQLYSSIDAFLITFLLIAWTPFRRHYGEVSALMMTVYPLVRILEEIIRTDELPVFGTGLSISQNVSLLILAVAAGVWAYVLTRPRLQYAPAM
jgi:phosphatidylglycerol---prolipoprotein diacylglyceryl transferase